MAEKTETLPGMAGEKIPELSTALEALREIRRTRMKNTKEESEAQDKVLALMHEHGILAYLDDDFDPPLDGKISKGKEKVRVKMGSQEDDDAADAD